MLMMVINADGDYICNLTRVAPWAQAATWLTFLSVYMMMMCLGQKNSKQNQHTRNVRGEGPRTCRDWYLGGEPSRIC